MEFAVCLDLDCKKGLNIFADPWVAVGIVTLQLVCDDCKSVLLEKTGEKNLMEERFPITPQEEVLLSKDHYGHNCHIEAVEKG